MKNILAFFIITACLTLSNCTQKDIKVKQFILIGKITDQDSGSIILQYGILSAFHSDTSIVKNGNFQFRGFLEEPTFSLIKENSQSNRTNLYLEPGVMNITLSKRNFKNFTLTGSKSQEELNSLNKSLESNNNHDSVLIKFVFNNPKSYLAPYYLQDLGFTAKISLDSLKLLFNRLDTAIQKSKFGRITKGVIKGIENTTAGNYASDFKAIDVNNQTLTLSQFKNKNIVLLDFWASWCIPCRESMPHLKTLYNKYHSKGLEIIGIASMDKNRQTWESAIKEDSTFMWYHIATFFQNGETINEDVTFDYPVGPIPRTILIYKDGKVLGNWVGNRKENEISLDNKLEMLFNK
jgi:thiol-disulfide isomerase/thioredoxin